MYDQGNMNQQPQPVPQKSKSGTWVVILYTILMLLVAAAAAAGGYIFGLGQEEETEPAEEVSHTVTLPADTTVIAECVDGLGRQHIEPENIPYGPIYNLHEGEVVGIQYMIASLALIEDDQTSMLLPEGTYNHLKVGNVEHGHAGFDEEHYHINAMFITEDEAKAIVCGDDESGMDEMEDDDEAGMVEDEDDDSGDMDPDDHGDM